MDDNRTGGPERAGFGALVSLLLAPVIAQGLWRPLAYFFGPSGGAGAVTGAALAISAVIVVVRRLLPDRAALLSLAVGGLVAIGASVVLRLGVPGLLTLLVVASAIAALVDWLPRRLPHEMDGLVRRHPALAALYLVAALFAVISVARLSIFIGDPSQSDQQVLPGVDFLETHSCLSAYARADALSRQGVDNLYDERWWHGSHGFPPLPPGSESPYLPFDLDYYAYPPPFLMAMTPLAPLEEDFAAQRALWFGLNGLLLAVGLWVTARWIDGSGAHRVLLLAPIFFGSLPVLATLQVGNFQIAVVVMSVLAMVAFDRDRPALGGALLAFATLSKLSPGVLGIVLLAQRRWRSVAWTVGLGLLFVALSLLSIGADPMTSFLTYVLPRLSSGDAFAFMDDDPFSVITNMAPFGLPFKLQLLGLDVGDPWVLARRIGRVYSVLLVILTVAAVWHPGDQGRRATCSTWLSLLVLAALQSPFAPGYAIIGLLWAITLLAVEVRGLRGGAGLVLLWVGLTVVVPTLSLRLVVAQSVLQSALTVTLPVWLIVRAGRHHGALESTRRRA